MAWAHMEAAALHVLASPPLGDRSQSRAGVKQRVKKDRFQEHELTAATPSAFGTTADTSLTIRSPYDEWSCAHRPNLNAGHEYLSTQPVSNLQAECGK